METSILVALSRQAALQRNLSVVANNLANMNTTAFKAERMLFEDHPMPVPVRAPGGAGGDSAVLSFVRDVATARDLSPGALEETGSELDVALPGDGFLAVETPLGERYSRGGHLRLDESGRLVTDHGLPVLAMGGAPVQLGLEATRIVIGRDGTISSDAGDAGRLRVVRFAHPERMLTVAGGLMSSDEAPEEMQAPDVLQGMLERSNVEPIAETERLIDVHRAYDQARLLIDREDERIKKMLQVYAA
jgi:flagellar basal-body rod protein FlgF